MEKTNTKILIVDDDERNQRILKEILAGYILDCASDGQQALSKAREFSPNLILLDVMMPGMSGLDVCKIIKNDQTMHNIKIILISGMAFQDDQERGMESGADAYITKPFSAEDIGQSIKALLGQ